MKFLSTEEAEKYLNNVGMTINEWGGVKKQESDNVHTFAWMQRKSPQNALELIVFSEHIIGWLGTGGRKLLKIDNSSSFTRSQKITFLNLLCQKEFKKIDEYPTVLFEPDDASDNFYPQDIFLTSIVSFFLTFEGHCYLVSTEIGSTRYVGIQDGFVYFFADEDGLFCASSMCAELDRTPLKSAQWIQRIDAIQ